MQPVVPITLNADWNLISRTILPLIDQEDVVPGDQRVRRRRHPQSLFFSPKKPTAGGLIWGVGPVFLLPTGSDDQLSARKWGVGPTGVVLKQQGPWTLGALANHIWSVAGDDDRPDISATFLQPFLAYTTPRRGPTRLTPSRPTTGRPSNGRCRSTLTVAKLLKVGEQPVSIGGGVRYWAESPDAGPNDWGLRLFVTFLFPK